MRLKSVLEGVLTCGLCFELPMRKRLKRAHSCKRAARGCMP